MEDEGIINEIEIEDSIKEDRRWCVYIHRNVHNNKCYVGITYDIKKRWGKNGDGYKRKYKNGKYVQPVFAHALEKYPDWDNDWEHKIVIIGLSYDDACQKEEELIELYHTNVYIWGKDAMGYNSTDGGQGVVGYKHSDEARKNMSKAKIGMYDGDKNPMYGKHHTEESKKKIREHLPDLSGENNPRYGQHCSVETKNKIKNALIGKMVGELNPFYGNHRFAGENNPFYGRKHSKESIEKMKLSSVGVQANYKNPRARAIFCPQLNRIFWGATGAAQELGLNRQNISNCCNGRRYKTVGKHPATGELLSWLYAEDAIEQGYITQEELDDYLKKLREKENNKDGETVQDK